MSDLLLHLSSLLFSLFHNLSNIPIIDCIFTAILMILTVDAFARCTIWVTIFSVQFLLCEVVGLIDGLRSIVLVLVDWGSHLSHLVLRLIVWLLELLLL